MACTPLVIAGSAVQAGGFVLALRHAGATRRQEALGHAPLHRQAGVVLLRSTERVLTWARLRVPRTTVYTDSGTGTVKFGASARASFRRGGLPTEERFDALEAEVQEHRAQQHDESEALCQRIDALGESLQETATRLEDERKRRLTRSLFWEEAGVWVFIIGLLISTIGALD